MTALNTQKMLVVEWLRSQQNTVDELTPMSVAQAVVMRHSCIAEQVRTENAGET